MKNMNWTQILLSGFLTVSTSPLMAMGMKANADPNAPPPPAWVSFAPMLVMIVIFYFLLIRPQSKQRNSRQQMLSNLKVGDRIVTQGGILATVEAIYPGLIDIKINEDTKVKIQRSAVTEVLDRQAEAALTSVPS